VRRRFPARHPATPLMGDMVEPPQDPHK